MTIGKYGGDGREDFKVWIGHEKLKKLIYHVKLNISCALMIEHQL